MRKLLVSVALATATLAAVPAAAQHHNSGWSQHGPDRRAVNQLVRELGQVETRIDRSARRGFISPREAFGLRRDANRVRLQLNRAGRNGLSGREYASLRVQVNRLEQRVRLERRDNDRRRG
jgi:sRNA-binding protein